MRRKKQISRTTKCVFCLKTKILADGRCVGCKKTRNEAKRHVREFTKRQQDDAEECGIVLPYLQRGGLK